ncbi:hypothetical protein CapIbe_022442, partial [Capra ibex]
QQLHVEVPLVPVGLLLSGVGA